MKDTDYVVIAVILGSLIGLACSTFEGIQIKPFVLNIREVK